MNTSNVEARQLILGTVYSSTRSERKHVNLLKLKHALQLEDSIFDREVEILREKNLIAVAEGRVSLTEEGEATIDSRIMSYCPHL